MCPSACVGGALWRGLANLLWSLSPSSACWFAASAPSWPCWDATFPGWFSPTCSVRRLQRSAEVWSRVSVRVGRTFALCPQLWAFSSGRSSHLTTSACGSNRCCRSWTLASESSCRRSERTTVTAADHGPLLKPHRHKNRSGVYLRRFDLTLINGRKAGSLLVFNILFVSERRLLQAQREHENVESDLSSMFPKVSKGHQSRDTDTQTGHS